MIFRWLEKSAQKPSLNSLVHWLFIFELGLRIRPSFNRRRRSLDAVVAEVVVAEVVVAEVVVAEVVVAEAVVVTIIAAIVTTIIKTIVV